MATYWRLVIARKKNSCESINKVKKKIKTDSAFRVTCTSSGDGSKKLFAIVTFVLNLDFLVLTHSVNTRAIFA